MTLGEGFKVALFCMGMVFTLLTVIYGLLKGTAAVITALENRGQRTEK